MSKLEFYELWQCCSTDISEQMPDCQHLIFLVNKCKINKITNFPQIWWLFTSKQLRMICAHDFLNLKKSHKKWSKTAYIRPKLTFNNKSINNGNALIKLVKTESGKWLKMPSFLNLRLNMSQLLLTQYWMVKVSHQETQKPENVFQIRSCENLSTVLFVDAFDERRRKTSQCRDDWWK